MANENIESPMGADEAEIEELGAEELQAASGGSLTGIVGLGDDVTNSLASGLENVANAAKGVVETGAADVAKAADWVGDAASKAGSAVETGVEDVAKGIWDASADWC